MTKKKYETLSTTTTLYRTRARHGRISDATQSDYKKLEDDDRHTVLARTVLYLQHKRKMLEPQQRVGVTRL